MDFVMDQIPDFLFFLDVFQIYFLPTLFYC